MVIMRVGKEISLNLFEIQEIYEAASTEHLKEEMEELFDDVCAGVNINIAECIKETIIAQSCELYKQYYRSPEEAREWYKMAIAEAVQETEEILDQNTLKLLRELFPTQCEGEKTYE